MKTVYANGQLLDGYHEIGALNQLLTLEGQILASAVAILQHSRHALWLCCLFSCDTMICDWRKLYDSLAIYVIIGL